MPQQQPKKIQKGFIHLDFAALDDFWEDFWDFLMVVPLYILDIMVCKNKGRQRYIFSYFCGLKKLNQWQTSNLLIM